MEKEFWLNRWQDNNIGFHEGKVNPVLSQHWEQTGVASDKPVFVPLCGKSVDMVWLRQRGHPVIGVEFSPLAVQAFFAENVLAGHRSRMERHELWSGAGYDIFCGDFFQLPPTALCGIGGVYDRAALVALPAERRREYASRLQSLLPAGVTMLLLTLDYPAGQIDGPPFAISDEEVFALYADGYVIETVYAKDILDPLAPLRERGVTSLVEKAYILRSKR